MKNKHDLLYEMQKTYCQTGRPFVGQFSVYQGGGSCFGVAVYKKSARGSILLLHEQGGERKWQGEKSEGETFSMRI